MARKKTQIELLAETVTKLAHTLYGNGEVGLCEEVRAIKKTLGLPVKIGAGLLMAGQIILIVITLARG